MLIAIANTDMTVIKHHLFYFPSSLQKPTEAGSSYYILFCRWGNWSTECLNLFRTTQLRSVRAGIWNTSLGCLSGVLSHSVMSDSYDSMACSPPGFSVHGILQARILEWMAISSSRGSSRPRDWTQVSCIAGGFFTSWATREALPLRCGSIRNQVVLPPALGPGMPRRGVLQ